MRVELVHRGFRTQNMMQRALSLIYKSFYDENKGSIILKYVINDCRVVHCRRFNNFRKQIEIWRHLIGPFFSRKNILV